MKKTYIILSILMLFCALLSYGASKKNNEGRKELTETQDDLKYSLISHPHIIRFQTQYNPDAPKPIITAEYDMFGLIADSVYLRNAFSIIDTLGHNTPFYIVKGYPNPFSGKEYYGLFDSFNQNLTMDIKYDEVIPEQSETINTDLGECVHKNVYFAKDGRKKVDLLSIDVYPKHDNQYDIRCKITPNIYATNLHENYCSEKEYAAFKEIIPIFMEYEYDCYNPVLPPNHYLNVSKKIFEVIKATDDDIFCNSDSKHLDFVKKARKYVDYRFYNDHFLRELLNSYFDVYQAYAENIEFIELFPDIDLAKEAELFQEYFNLIIKDRVDYRFYDYGIISDIMERRLDYLQLILYDKPVDSLETLTDDIFEEFNSYVHYDDVNPKSVAFYDWLEYRVEIAEKLPVQYIKRFNTVTNAYYTAWKKNGHRVM